MKNITYTLTAFLLLSFHSISAQMIGVKGGLNFSDAKADVFVDAINDAPSAHTSFVFGGFVELPITNNFSFQPELLYTQRGFNLNESTSLNLWNMELPIGARVTTSINYIEAPLLGKVSIGSGATKFYGVAGPSIGYATSATIQPSITLLIDVNLPSIDVDLSDRIYNRTDVSGIIGAGVEHGVNGGKLFTDLRYQHSFTNMLNDPIVDVSVRNAGVQWTVGYSHAF